MGVIEFLRSLELHTISEFKVHESEGLERLLVVVGVDAGRFAVMVMLVNATMSSL